MQISEAYEGFFLSKKRYDVLMGGAGSGKSFVTAQKIITRIISERGHRILCCRKVANTIGNSIYRLFIDILEAEGLLSYFEINKTEKRFTHIVSGNEIILAGLDDPEKIKSIAGITSVWCEEATEFEEADFNQLELRVRGETVNHKQFIITFNPIDEGHWLKARFFDTPDDDVFILKTTYADNPFLDAEYIKHLTERIRSNEQLYKVYVLGEWGKVIFGGEFLKCWKSSVHTGKYPYNPELAVYLSFDENVNPYFPCGIFQVSKDEKEFYLIDCIAAKNPNNTVKWMCGEITRKLHQWGHKENVYIVGDATSQKDDVKQEKGHDLFRLIINELKEFSPIRRVSKSNPSVKASAEFFNSILEMEIEGLRFRADEKCRPAILDYENTKEDKNGGVDKKTVTDSVTKVSYQPWGHFVDLTRYALTTVFSAEYARYKNGGHTSFVRTGDRATSKNSY